MRIWRPYAFHGATRTDDDERVYVWPTSYSSYAVILSTSCYIYIKSKLIKKKTHSCNKKQLREDKFIVSYPMIVKMDFTKGGQLL